MAHPRWPLLPLILGSLAAMAAPAAEEWQLTFKKQVVAAGKDGAEPQLSEEIVRIGESSLSIGDAKSRTLYDFKERRVLQLDLAGKKSRDSSLYADIDFRQAELQNRRGLAGMLKDVGGQVEGAPLDALDNEIAFGLDSGSPEGRSIERKTEGDTVAFTARGKTITAWKPGATPVPPALRKGFTRFLVYGCRLHPSIRRALGDERTFPVSLEFEYRDTSDRYRVKLELKDARKVPGERVKLPAGFKREGPERIDALARRAGDPKSPRLDPKQSEKWAQEALEKGRRLDAFLALLEMGLQSDRKSPELMRKIVGSAGEDEVLRNYLAGLEGRDPKGELAILDSLPREGLTRVHILDVNRAVLLSSLGRLEEAEGLFRRALEVNPHLASVWKDLGDVFGKQYHTVEAWRCWEVALGLCPQHWVVQDIGQHRKWLEEKFPDFF